MSRKQRANQKRSYYGCFLCEEQRNADLMPWELVFDHKVCFMCKKKYTQHSHLETAVTEKEDEHRALLDDANREMLGDDVAEAIDLGILPDDIGNK